MRIRRLSAAAAVLIPFALAAPVAGAATTPAASSRAAKAPVFTFVPPRVGPLTVNLGPTIIDGQQISPGVNVFSPGVSLPPITWSPSF
jgi:hypothetical protein